MYRYIIIQERSHREIFCSIRLSSSPSIILSPIVISSRFVSSQSCDPSEPNLIIIFLYSTSLHL